MRADTSPRGVLSPFPTCTATHTQLTCFMPTDTRPQPLLLWSLSPPAVGARHATPTAELPPPQFLSLVPLAFQGTCQGVPSRGCRSSSTEVPRPGICQQAGWGWAVAGQGAGTGRAGSGPLGGVAQPKGSMFTSGGLCVPGAAHPGL